MAHGRYLCFKGATGNVTKFVFPAFGHPFLISTISTFSLAQKAGWYWGCLEEFCGSSGSTASNFIFPIFSLVFPEPIDPSHAPLAFRCFLSGVSGADASNPPAVEILWLLPSLGGMRWDRLWLVGGDWNHGILWLSIQLGISSSQLTFTHIFFRGVSPPPTRWDPSCLGRYGWNSSHGHGSHCHGHIDGARSWRWPSCWRDTVLGSWSWNFGPELLRSWLWEARWRKKDRLGVVPWKPCSMAPMLWWLDRLRFENGPGVQIFGWRPSVFGIWLGLWTRGIRIIRWEVQMVQGIRLLASLDHHRSNGIKWIKLWTYQHESQLKLLCK